MSYNKNTVIDSKIDSVVETLEGIGHDYDLITIDYVEGRGINDTGMDMNGYANNRSYPIRMIVYANLSGKLNCHLEHMVRDPDCDSDDRIVSSEYKDVDYLPDSHYLEITINADEFDVDEIDRYGKEANPSALYDWYKVEKNKVKVDKSILDAACRIAKNMSNLCFQLKQGNVDKRLQDPEQLRKIGQLADQWDQIHQSLYDSIEEIEPEQ